jgi:hypothetical protein
MVTTFDWAAPGSYAAGNLVTGNGTAGDMKNLANAASAIGAEVDNEGGSILAGIELRVRCASAPSGSPYIEVWFLTDLGGSSYEDGAAGAPGTVPARAPDLIIPVRLVSTQQVIALGPVPLPNACFKALLRNSTGQAFTNTDSENQLSYRAWKTEGS